MKRHPLAQGADPDIHASLMQEIRLFATKPKGARRPDRPSEAAVQDGQAGGVAGEEEEEEDKDELGQAKKKNEDDEKEAEKGEDQTDGQANNAVTDADPVSMATSMASESTVGSKTEEKSLLATKESLSSGSDEYYDKYDEFDVRAVRKEEPKAANPAVLSIVDRIKSSLSPQPSPKLSPNRQAFH